MKMQIGRWGNSLAVRLPKSLTNRFRLHEGDSIDVETFAAALEAELGTPKRLSREAAIAAMAARARPLPPDWRFDREEANARGPR